MTLHRPRTILVFGLLVVGSARAAPGVPVANTAPVSADVDLDATEDASVTTDLKASDEDGNTLTFRLVKGPKQGEASLTSGGQLIYTPKPDVNGKDELVFEVSDGKARVKHTVRITVGAVNDRPTAAALELRGVEDQRIGGAIKGSDVDKDPLRFALGKAPARGAVEIDAATGRLTFAPEANQHGAVAFVVRMSDGTVDVDVPVTVSLAPVNDAPVASDDEQRTREDTPLPGTLQAHDPDQDTLSFALAAPPAHGRVELDAAKGSYLFTPAPDYVGPDSFAFTVSDGKASAKGSVRITVQGVNDAPTVAALALSGAEDQPMAGRVVAKDADGDAITFKLASDPKHGEAEVDTESGLARYTPAGDFVGVDSFVVEASDLAGGVPAVVTVTVTPVNDPPQAGEDRSKGDEDQPIVGRLRATDVDQDTLRYTLTKGTRSGKVEVEVDGSFRYQPNANFHGDDTFTFEVSDGRARATGSMALVVAPVNDAPRLAELSLSGREDEPLKGRALATDIDGDTLEYAVAKQGSKGSAAIDEATGAVIYTPKANEHGADALTISVSDGRAKAEAALRVSLSPVNDAPEAQAGAAQGEEDHPLQGDLIATDVDGDALSFRVLTQARRGALELDPKSGAWRFTPRAHEHGKDSFRFEVSDGKLRAAAEVALTIGAVNDAPEVRELSLATSEDKPVSGAVSASDVDGDKLTWSLGLAPTKGTLTVDATSGRVSYAPKANEHGDDSCMVEVGDGTTKSAAKVLITIAPVNDAPVAHAGKAAGLEDAVQRGALAASDVDRDALGFTLVRAPKLGAVQIDPVGTWTYTPRPNQHGEDAFRFAVSDGKLSSEGEVTLTISAVNDAPTAGDQALVTLEDRELRGTIKASDVDGDVLSYRVQAPGKLGVVSIDDATGAFRYQPLRDRSGLDRFVVAVSDGLLVREAGVTVELTPAPDAPVIDPRPIETAEDEPVSVELAGVDADGEQLTFTIVTPTVLGTAELLPDGRTLRFVPAADAHGEHRLVVEASDGKHRVRAALPVRVAPKNDAPTLEPASAQTQEELAVLVPLVTHDKDGDVVQLALGGAPVRGASLIGHLLKVAPPQDLAGVLNVVVTASDPSGASTSLTVPITVANVNDAPVVKDLALTVAPGQRVTGAIVATDADPGDALTFVVAVPPRQGTLTLDDARVGTFSYSAAPGASGDDSFRVRVRDQAGASATAAVRVTLAAPAPAPAPAVKPTAPR